MKGAVFAWFGMLAVVVTVLASMAHAAKTDPANVEAHGPANMRAYGAVHGIVIPPFSR
jgi:hypothetical protein